MSTVFKVLVISLAGVGLCVMLTHYIPSSWSAGWELPVLKMHVSWAVTGVLGFMVYLIAKLKLA